MGKQNKSKFRKKINGGWKLFVDEFWNNNKWLTILMVALLCTFIYFQLKAEPEDKPENLQDLVTNIQEEHIERINVYGSTKNVYTFYIKLKSKTKVKYYVPEYLAKTLIEECAKKKVDVIVTSNKEPWEYFLDFLKVFWLFCLILFVLNGLKGLSNSSFSAELEPQQSDIRFDDVAGNEHAKKSLESILSSIENREEFSRLNSKPLKGVLLEGPPGVGKTLLVQALAGEGKIPLISLSGSSFIEIYVGVGPKRVRAAFNEAKKYDSCIIFIDEIDSIGGKRNANKNSEESSTLNELLRQMDGFSKNEGIFVVAATNRADCLDEGLTRPGRFDRTVSVSVPSRRERTAIFKAIVKKQGVPVSEDVCFNALAGLTPGFTGAKIAALVNEASMLANVAKKNTVGFEDFDTARDIMIMGENSTIELSKTDERNTAHHEAGHTVLVMHFHKVTDPLYKVTIIPRGTALGMVVQVPESEHYNYTRENLYATLCILMAGRVAERIKAEPSRSVSCGALNDFERADKLSARMIFELGMAEDSALQDIGFGLQKGSNGHYDFGLLSSETKELLSKEKDNLLTSAREYARKILIEEKTFFDALVDALIEKKNLV